ncbi:MAG: ABC transporter permease [Vicinamibacterales bacterium]
MSHLVQDVRFACRLVQRSPFFALVAVATVAIGVGANTAAFSVVNGVLLRPLPYPDSDRLVRLSELRPSNVQGIRGAFLSNYVYYAWKDTGRTLEGIAAYSAAAATATDFGDPVRLQGENTTANLFDMLRVRPLVGRFFRAGEGARGAAPVVVLSHRLWTERFGGDAAAIGKSLTLDGKAHEIIGVAPPDFYFPTRDAAYWTTYEILEPPKDPHERAVMLFSAIGRLASGVSADAAAAEGTGLARGSTSLATDPIFGQNTPISVRARPIVDELTAEVRPAILVIWATVALMLLVACANLASLLLSRGVARQRELAVRGAIGASRERLFTQLLTESVLLSLLGGALGAGLALAAVRALPAFAPADFPRLDDVHLDARVLAFTLLTSMVSGVALGLAPALYGARRNLLGTLHTSGNAPSSGFSRAGAEGLRRMLIVLEAAVAIVLLVGASLLLRSFSKLVDTDVGFRPGNLLTAQLVLPRALYTPAKSGAVVDAIFERLRAMPEVVAAGASNMMPLARTAAIMAFDMPPAGPGEEPISVRALQYVVTPGLADALGLRLVAGRFVEDDDRAGAPRSLVVNESFVRQYIRDGRAVGRTIPGMFEDEGQPATIVGVVGDVRRDGYDGTAQPEIYLSQRQSPRGPLGGTVYLAIRTRGEPTAIVPALRAVVRDIDGTAALDGVATMSDRLAASVAQPRFAAFVMTTFAAITLMLTATGLFGVLSYGVAQRRAELGVRKALGAREGDLVGLVVRQGLGLTLVGVAIGMAAAVFLARYVSSLLFGVSPTDVVSFAAAAGAVAIVAGLACWWPARRAARVDALEALRAD